MGARVLLSSLGGAIVLWASSTWAQAPVAAPASVPAPASAPAPAPAREASPAPAVLAVGAPASPAAENLTAGLTSPYTLIVGVERILVAGPFTQSSDSSGSGLSFGAVGFAGSTDDGYTEPFLPHTMPRVTADAVLAEGFTVGALAGIGRAFGSTPNNGSSDADTVTPVSDQYLAGGRVGYLAPLADNSAAFWGRLGLVYAWGSERTRGLYGEDVDQESSLVAAELEATLLFPVVAHFGLSLGIGGDIALKGTLRSEPAGDTPSLPLDRTTRRRDSDAFFLWLGAFGYI